MIIEVMERKLTTILAADVVGYSKMIAHNETTTLELLKERRSLIDGFINDYGGSIFGSAGDSVIVRFDSPVRATESAIRFQSKMRALNEIASEDKKMTFRVGINIGDVIVSDNNLFGDAVNIAARLEAASHPAGVCVSKSVVDMIERKLKVSFEDAGELELKNIEHPVPAYFVVPSKNEMRFSSHSETPRITVEKSEPGSLAVMLFKSLGADEDQEYFCEGFSEDLISALSQFQRLLVISGNASFSYRQSEKTPREIGQQLGVRYILEGSVRKLGKKIRINASLISTDQEKPIWSNKFDAKLNEIFDIQDELVETIVSTIAGRLEADETRKINLARPDNLDAYDLVLKGLEFHRRSGVTRENAEKAAELFAKAVDTDPGYARAYAWKACSMANVVQWTPDRYGDNWLETCLDSVMRALELDADDAEVHRILGAIKLVKREFESALYHHERARELCPSDPHILAKYATMLIYIGENEKALSEITKAKRIDPFCPDILFEDEGICYYWLQNYGEAVSSFSKLKIPTRNSLFYLAATYIKFNNIGQAKATLAEAVSMSNLTVEDFIVTQSYKNEIHSRELLETLKNITAQT